MKYLKLKIQIDALPDTVFEFVTNPANTSRWIDSIVREETNESPPKLGTIYRNQNQAGQWSEYEMTKFDPDKMFIMSSRNSPYRVRYTLTPVDGRTELEYYEWVESGELEEPFTLEPLEKLKSILEKPA